MYYEKENKKSDYVTPLTTSPYDFKANRSTTPKWEEILVFNESFTHFTRSKPNCLLIFEIIDKATNLQRPHTSQDTEPTWNRIAWAFLKPLATNNTLNTEKKIRLQLFYSPNQYRFNHDLINPFAID